MSWKKGMPEVDGWYWLNFKYASGDVFLGWLQEGKWIIRGEFGNVMWPVDHVARWQGPLRRPKLPNEFSTRSCDLARGKSWIAKSRVVMGSTPRGKNYFYHTFLRHTEYMAKEKKYSFERRCEVSWESGTPKKSGYYWVVREACPSEMDLFTFDIVNQRFNYTEVEGICLPLAEVVCWKGPIGRPEHPVPQQIRGPMALCWSCMKVHVGNWSKCPGCGGGNMQPAHWSPESARFMVDVIT